MENAFRCQSAAVRHPRLPSLVNHAAWLPLTAYVFSFTRDFSSKSTSHRGALAEAAVKIVVFIAFLFAALDSLVSPATCNAEQILNAGIGANKFDLLLQFTGRASGGDGSPAYRHVDRAMGEKAIYDAREMGFTFFRVAASGFGPFWPSGEDHNDLALWLTDPSTYWGEVDAMMDALDKAGMKLVPSLLWNISQFPSLTHETTRDFITNLHSKSRALALRYIASFIERYKGRSTILFYEIGNEYNLLADIETVLSCKEQFGIAEYCSSRGNFSSGELTRFASEMVSYIKLLDPSRAISSGYSTPRPAADHLAKRPGHSTEGKDWQSDDRDEFVEIMRSMNVPFDIVSLHIYPGGDNLRPKLGIRSEAGLVDLVQKLFRSKHKLLFVGEFGSDTPSPLVAEIIRRNRESDLYAAAIWCFECYQFSIKTISDESPNGFQIEPGHADPALDRLKRHVGSNVSPRVVLTEPLPCARVTGKFELSATASEGSSLPGKVVFLINSQEIGFASAPPYTTHLKEPLGAGGIVLVTARAYGKNGQLAESQYDVVAGDDASTCNPEALHPNH